MTQAVARKLIFRLSGVAFSLDLSFIVEICEPATALLDTSCADTDAGIVGSLSFRNTKVPAIDPALVFDLPASIPYSAKTALLLNSSEGNWALLVDRVGEISQADKFKPLVIPPLLRGTIGGSYSQVELFDREPVVCFEPERFYGATGLAI